MFFEIITQRIGMHRTKKVMLIITTLLFTQQSNYAIDWKAYNKWRVALGITAVGTAAAGLGYLIYVHGKIHSLENNVSNFNIFRTRAEEERRKIQQAKTELETVLEQEDPTEEDAGHIVVKTISSNLDSLEELCNILSGRQSERPDPSEGGDALML